jgi:hypothetical protein
MLCAPLPFLSSGHKTNLLAGSVNMKAALRHCKRPDYNRILPFQEDAGRPSAHQAVELQYSLSINPYNEHFHA